MKAGKGRARIAQNLRFASYIDPPYFSTPEYLIALNRQISETNRQRAIEKRGQGPQKIRLSSASLKPPKRWSRQHSLLDK